MTESLGASEVISQFSRQLNSTLPLVQLHFMQMNISQALKLPLAHKSQCLLSRRPGFADAISNLKSQIAGLKSQISFAGLNRRSQIVSLKSQVSFAGLKSLGTLTVTGKQLSRNSYAFLHALFL